MLSLRKFVFLTAGKRSKNELVVLLLFGFLFSFAISDEGRNVKKNNVVDSMATNIQLTNDLLNRHGKKLRPVFHPNDTLEVHVLASIYQIIDVDQRKNLIDISAYFDLWWIDPFLTWNPEDYDWTFNTYLNAADVWSPDLYLYHSTQGSSPLSVHHSAAQINSSGMVRVFIPFTAKAFCPINVKYFPFEKLDCHFNFGSWSYTKQQIKYLVAESNVSLNEFFDNQEWLLENATLSGNETEYANSFVSEVFSVITLAVSLKRGSFYYIFNLVIPSTMVTVVSVIGFHAACNSTQRRESKFRLGIMTLLSMGVLLLNVVDNMPKFSMVSQPGKRGSFSDIPLLGFYYLSMICIISSCTCTSYIFVSLETYAIQHTDSFPRWLKWLTESCSGQRAKMNDNKKDPFLYTNAKQSSALTETEELTTFNEMSSPIELPVLQAVFRKEHTLENVLLPVNKNFERLHETCKSLLYEIKEIHSNIENEKKIEAKKRPSSNLLTADWECFINRMERLSLFIYLSLIAMSLFMFFNHTWY